MGLTSVASRAQVAGEGSVFDHRPLAGGLYEQLCAIYGEPRLEEYDKALYANAVNLLELFDARE